VWAISICDLTPPFRDALRFERSAATGEIALVPAIALKAVNGRKSPSPTTPLGLLAVIACRAGSRRSFLLQLASSRPATRSRAASSASAKRGVMRRGREVHQLDIGYPESSLALEKPERQGGVLAGDRAPEVPMRGVAGPPVRLINLFQGTHWTLLGYEIDAASLIAPRAHLHIHRVGRRGDIIDDGGHFHAAYGLTPETRVLVRPDAYVGAIVSAGEVGALSQYLNGVGLTPFAVPGVRRM
jgi:hypothetical protein